MTPIVTAIYDFEGQSAEELSLKEGDRIILLSKDEGGWWHGKKESKHCSLHLDLSANRLDATDLKNYLRLISFVSLLFLR